MFPSSKFAAGIFMMMVAAPSVAQAQGHETNCALIVASRPTIMEAHKFRHQNPHLSVETIFQSANGWLAISTGIYDKRRAPQILAEMKSRNYIPQDSYCSDGAAYVDVVWSSDRIPGGGPKFDYNMDAYAPFDARPLSVHEKRVLQAGMAYFGHYNGLLDGVWGNGTQGAFEDFARERLGAADQNWAASELLRATVELWSVQDWRYFGLDQFDASIQMPMALVESSVITTGAIAFSNADGTTNGNVVRSDSAFVRQIHEDLFAQHVGRDDPYVLRKDDLWVTTALSGEVRGYIRSFWSPRLGQWVSLMINFPQAQSEVANFMISSFQQGPAAPLHLPDDAFMTAMTTRHENEGRLDRLAFAAIPPQLSSPAVSQQTAPIPRAPEPAPVSAPRPAPEPAPSEETASNGSGFFLNAAGSVLTNEHVAGNCPGMTVNGRPARLVAASEEFDLALVEHTQPREVEHYLSFSPSAGRLNSDVTVAGFPLRAVLGGLNITRGAISSMQGLGGNWTEMQISAPVQSGNSGGPIVDRYGNVVGVVVSKLDAIFSVEVFGDMPQNVNFGIRGELGKTFAELHDVDFSIGEEVAPLAPEDLAVLLEKATVLIECR